MYILQFDLEKSWIDTDYTLVLTALFISTYIHGKFWGLKFCLVLLSYTNNCQIPGLKEKL